MDLCAAHRSPADTEAKAQCFAFIEHRSVKAALISPPPVYWVTSTTFIWPFAVGGMGWGNDSLGSLGYIRVSQKTCFRLCTLIN